MFLLENNNLSPHSILIIYSCQEEKLDHQVRFNERFVEMSWSCLNKGFAFFSGLADGLYRFAITSLYERGD